MDCGIPFCHQGCPLGNIIPEWNDLVWRGDWDGAIERLHATNNFPEFTGRLCPAPCETACVLGINQDPVTIKNVEVAIIDRAWESGAVRPQPPEWLSGKTVAVIGSGPAGLAAAQQLTRAGHTVAVYERADKIGGLLRYGIPEFKMEKKVLDRRLDQMRREGTVFRAGVDVGATLTGDQLRDRYDTIVLAMGATAARDLPVPGRELGGIHQAMEYLPQSNRASLDQPATRMARTRSVPTASMSSSSAAATPAPTASARPSASRPRRSPSSRSWTRPGEERPANQPWPTYPMLFRVSSAHEEGGERVYSVSTKQFLADGDGNVRALQLVEVTFENGKFSEVEGTEREIPAELVLLAMGFTGPEQPGLVEQLGVQLDERGNVARDAGYESSVARRVRRGGLRSRPVADRVGHRGGPRRGRRRRHLAQRLDQPAGPDPADGAPDLRISGRGVVPSSLGKPPLPTRCFAWEAHGSLVH